MSSSPPAASSKTHYDPWNTSPPPKTTYQLPTPARSTNGMASSTAGALPFAFEDDDGGDQSTARADHEEGDHHQNYSDERPEHHLGGFGSPSSLADASPLPTLDPKQVELVHVRMTAPEGWLIKHNMYAVECESKSSSVGRRFSDFVWLLDCLVKRYPFRLLPSLPPKRVAINGHHLTSGDETAFLERRRRGLQRFLTYLVNHPVLSGDPLISTFLTEPSDLATWRSHHSPLHLVEESSTKRLSPQEELSIPRDLDEKLSGVRRRLPGVIEHWSRVCAATERIVRRDEAQATDFNRIQTGLGSAMEIDRGAISSSPLPQSNGTDTPSTVPGAAAGSSSDSWRIDDLCRVDDDVESVAAHLGRHAEIVDARARGFSLGIQEALRAQRDLHADFAALFARFDRLSGDRVDTKLRPRVAATVKKLDALKHEPLPDSEEARRKKEDDEARLVNHIEADRNTIEALLKRRVYIRWCMWREWGWSMRWATTLGEAVRRFAAEEKTFAERALGNWKLLGEALGDPSAV